MVTSRVQVEKGIEPLDLVQWKRRQVAIQEDQAGELGLCRLHLKYYNERALKCLLKLKPYYHYPSIESSSCTCDTNAD